MLVEDGIVGHQATAVTSNRFARIGTDVEAWVIRAVAHGDRHVLPQVHVELGTGRGGGGIEWRMSGDDRSGAIFSRPPWLDRSRSFDMMPVMRIALSRDVEQAQRWFHALSDETRLQLLELLREGEQCVCDLTDALDAAQSRLSFHLKTLKDAGLVTDRKQGRWVYYALNQEAVDGALDFLSELRPKRSGLRLLPRQCD